MSSNRIPLHRHRRRSDHISPTSPSYTRRLHDRPNRYSDVLSPVEGASATDDADSPTINFNPVSTYSDNHHPQPLTSALPRPAPVEQRPSQIASEDPGWQRHALLDQDTRPATSDAIDTKHAYSASRLGPNSLEIPSRPSPVTSQSSFGDYRERRSFEPPVKPTDTAPSPNLRNYSFSTQLLDRPNEDPSHLKNATAKKSRLNLLNPMSLLARRRFSQNQKLEDVNLTIKTLSVPALPDNFDPSIRGKVVHDFSAPRTRRQYSQNDIGLLDSPALRSGHGPDPNRLHEPQSGKLAPLSGTSNQGHSPMFREHFQDDRPALQPDRTGYLHNISAFNIAHDGSDATNVPAFAKKLPMAVPHSDSILNRSLPDKENIPLIPQAEPSPPPPTPPPKRTPSPKFEAPPPAALPKHMTSTSSRFSFQIGGAGSSAQEKLLEEKHKQHAQSQKTASKDIEEEDDEYANYDFDADDGLEEEIPSFNADLYGDIGGLGSNAPQSNAFVAKYGLNDEDGFGAEMYQSNAQTAKYPPQDDDFGFNDDPPTNALMPKYAPVQEVPDDSDVLEARYNALAPKYPPPSAPLPDIPVIKTTTLHRQSLQGFHFTPQSLTFSPTSTNNASQPTPRDHEGFAIGIADSKDLSQSEHVNADYKDEELDVNQFSMIGGLGITAGEVVRGRRRSQQVSRPHAQVFDDDDLYFDDGEFGDITDGPTDAVFDEQIFDDETGKIRDIPAENARKLDAAKAAARLDSEVALVGQKHDTINDSFYHAQAAHRSDSGAQDLNKPRHVSQTSFGQDSVAGLTETNLAAYHDALAYAANQAAANGRFDRKVSFSQTSDDTSPSYGNSHRGIISDDSRFGFSYSSGIAEDDGFPFEDDLEDDPMIAEANAEALENDEDGFYGQEFGFYAHSYAKGNSELTNGGYFADRGSNGVKRSHSGKANFQEPSLTPITERSEWSTRNSVVCLQMPGGIPGSAQSMPSPGIAQLLELDSPGYDDDMSFSALMRLRGRAFGGSSSSVNSAGGQHPLSSPLAHVSHHPFSHSDFNSSRMSSGMHGQSSSAPGIPESEEEDDDDANRPTLTQNTPRKKPAEIGVYTSQEDLPVSPAVASDHRKGYHSRTSSGADSVSYQRDADGRWLLERRRTDEEGGNEVIDHEIPTLRWGIVATGLISSWFVGDLIIPRKDPKANHVIQAVGSSSVEKGEAFVSKNIPDRQPRVYGSYKELYQDPNIDIIYIGTPHALHKKNCLEAIEAGKHVLCEKPLALNADEANEIFTAAKVKGNIFVMEAMWTRFFPLVRTLQQLVHQEKIIGDVQRVFCDFAMDMNIAAQPPTSRLRNSALGAGSLLDIGIYSLTWGLLAMGLENTESPPKIAATQQVVDGIDISSSFILQYPKSQAILTSSTLAKTSETFCRIEGNQGVITVDGFVASAPASFTVHKAGTSTRHDFERSGKGFFWEADEVALAIARGKTEHTLIPWNETLRVLGILDEVRRQGGAKFPQDKR
ncbi:hypothetical protein LTR84_009088 [Exophiala bonariae]|uniref:D-xylose 1-dehydrogenase (NADP(+), D-xylono-1,5-lactone-forming) n=1 Tax=Exophiala bonariae TaxID=1690606 RepID=A0AAV9MVM9_9EURO|nr:hypothetical protein LTR84_009088 [Exophiala bonariae]